MTLPADESSDSKPGKISNSEWHWTIGWSIAVLVSSCIPYLIAALSAPEGWQFSGLLVNPTDGYTYLSKMRLGFEGHWLLYLTYTPEPHDGVFIYTYYLALGHLSALLNLPLILTFHLARLAASLWLLIALYQFIGYVTPQIKVRRLAFLLLISSSGLGWLGIVAFSTTPIDVWVTEAFIPHTIYASPHFPAATALMLLILRRIVWPEDERWSVISVGLLALALSMVQPFALLITWIVLGLFWGWSYLTRQTRFGLQFGLIAATVIFAAPIVVYDYWITQSNPVIAGWSAQNITEAPTILEMVLGFGLVGLLAITGAADVIRRRMRKVRTGEWLLLIWAVSTFAAIYLPFNLQRRLIHGLQIPLGILAAIGLVGWLSTKRISAKNSRLIAVVVILTGLIGTVFVWSIPMLVALQSPDQSELAALLYIRREEAAAFEWLNENVSETDVILASPRVGMLIPSQTKARVFYGHVYETLNSQARKNTAEAFFRGDNEAVPVEVDYIFYGPLEQAQGLPETLLSLPVVYATDSIHIYEVSDNK